MIPQEIIKDIASELSMGFRAFIHKSSLKTLFITHDNFINDDMLTDDLDYIEFKKDGGSYFEVVKWSSTEAYTNMELFAESIIDNKNLKGQLLIALSQKKPFREFKYIIDNAGKYRDLWFRFQEEWQQAYVKEYIQMNFDLE